MYSSIGLSTVCLSALKKEVEQDEGIEEVVYLNNRIFSEESITLEMAKRMCTDMKANRRVFMPLARPVKED